jgi:tetrahydromethanopterin S-methyltransferase subunit B
VGLISGLFAWISGGREEVVDMAGRFTPGTATFVFGMVTLVLAVIFLFTLYRMIQ